MRPGVSAIVTCMTAAEFPFIDETLDSVVPQVDQTILCIQDSFDNFEDNRKLSRFKGREVTVVRMPLLPLGEVRNRGLVHVQHEWVAYCDGDDVWTDGKVAQQLECLKASAADFCGCDHVLIDDSSVVRLHAFARHIPMPSSWMVKASVMKEIPFDGTLRCVEDGDWWIRSHSKIKKARLAQPLLKYRVRSGSLSAATASKRRKMLFMRLAEIPVLGNALKLLTWARWRMVRSSEYLWNEDWGR